MKLRSCEIKSLGIDKITKEFRAQFESKGPEEILYIIVYI